MDLGGLSCPVDGALLYFAAQQGYTDVIRVLLDRGSDVAAPNAKGNSALTIAAGSMNLACVTLLLERGASANSLNSQRRGPLHYAACGKAAAHIDMAPEKEKAIQLLIMQKLLDANADINHVGDYGSPLQEAIDDGFPDAADFLRRLGGRPGGGPQEMLNGGGGWGQSAFTSGVDGMASFMGRPDGVGGGGRGGGGGGGGGSGGGGGQAAGLAARAQADPSIMASMQDPEIIAAMTAMQSNPANLQMYMANPKVTAFVQNLQGMM
jgi:hypothetical protein